MKTVIDFLETVCAAWGYTLYHGSLTGLRMVDIAYEMLYEGRM